MRESLLPLAALVTPNLDEAAILTGRPREVTGVYEDLAATARGHADAVAYVTTYTASGSNTTVSAAVAVGLALVLTVARLIRRESPQLRLAGEPDPAALQHLDLEHTERRPHEAALVARGGGHSSNLICSMRARRSCSASASQGMMAASSPSALRVS